MMREVEVGATSREETGGNRAGKKGKREWSRPGSGQLSRGSKQQGRGEGRKPRRGGCEAA